uniref:Large ribosomal subunit protein bL12 C-terminal domain-containing protein n=1 Tax=Arcella intermedia TaxID=1963864 RepID=A0A6B2LQU7_9EUKA
MRSIGFNEEQIEKVLLRDPPAVVAPQPQAQQEAAPPPPAEPEKVEVKEQPKQESKESKSASVKLISFPEGSKMHVLKEVRKLKPGMNLLESKKLVENLPQILQKNVLPEEQKEWKTLLEAVGAVIEFV